MFFILLVFLSLACFPVAGVATIHPIKTPKTNRSISKKHTIYTQIATRSETLAKVHSRSKRRAKLLSNYRHWHGTRYRLGGTTHRAVDCSALTRNLYWETFQMKLPRTTGGQLNRGKRIARGRLRIGDLVFFHTGHYQNHVGVYVGQGRFIHASRKKGVTISSMNDDYWTHHYLTARRILKETPSGPKKPEPVIERDGYLAHLEE